MYSMMMVHLLLSSCMLPSSHSLMLAMKHRTALMRSSAPTQRFSVDFFAFLWIRWSEGQYVELEQEEKTTGTR